MLADLIYHYLFWFKCASKLCKWSNFYVSFTLCMQLTQRTVNEADISSPSSHLFCKAYIYTHIW